MLLAQFGGLGQVLRWPLKKLGDKIGLAGNIPYRWARSMMESSGVLPDQTDALLSALDKILEQVSNELRSGEMPDDILRSQALRPAVDEGLTVLYVLDSQGKLNRALDLLEARDFEGTLEEATARVDDRVGGISSYTSANHRGVDQWDQENQSYLENLRTLGKQMWNIIKNPPSLKAAWNLVNKAKDFVEEALYVKDLMRSASSIGLSGASIFKVSRDIDMVVDDAFFPAGSRSAIKLAAANGSCRYVEMSPAVSQHLLSSMSSSAEEYETIVRAIIDRADHGDTIAVGAAVADLQQMFDGLERDQLLALIPCIAGASSGFSKVQNFDRLYDSAMEAEENAELKRASFNSALASYLMYPMDPIAAPILRDVGSQAMNFTREACDSITSAVMSVMGDSAASFLSCADVSVPDSLVINQIFQLPVRVIALGGASAVDAFIRIRGDSAVTIMSSDSLYLGEMDPGEDTTVTSSVTLSDRGMASEDSIGFGLIRLLPASAYGYGMSSVKIVSAKKGQYTGVEPPTGTPLSKNALHPCYPNPFNPVCTIRYDIAHAGRASLRMFAVNGSVVRTLVDAWREPGVYSEMWNGRADNGKQLPSGVYFYRLEAGDFVATRKMVLLR
jgi:hypothetical protein